MLTRIWHLPEGLDFARGVPATHAVMTTLEACLEYPFTVTIANERLHSTQVKNTWSNENFHILSSENNLYCNHNVMHRKINSLPECFM